MSDQRLIELGNTAMKNAQWTNAAGHFEELNARIKAYDPPEQHPLWGVIDQTGARRSLHEANASRMRIPRSREHSKQHLRRIGITIC